MMPVTGLARLPGINFVVCSYGKFQPCDRDEIPQTKSQKSDWIKSPRRRISGSLFLSNFIISTAHLGLLALKESFSPVSMLPDITHS